MAKLIQILSVLLVLTSCTFIPNTEDDKNFHGFYKIGEPYKIDGKWYHPHDVESYEEVGIASWYGPDFHGKKTANGDKFDQYSLTAAHKTLPLPSMVKVTNLENGKNLVVMVNDRGPFVDDRIIDLSKRSAQILGIHNKGTAKVKLKYLPAQTKRLLAGLPNKPHGLKVITEKTSTEVIMQANVDELKPISLARNKIITPIDYPAEKNNVNIKRVEEKKTVNLTIPQEETKLENNFQNDPTNYYIQAGTYGMINNAQNVENKLKSIGNVIVSTITRNDKSLYRVKVGPFNNKEDAKLVLAKVINSGHKDAIVIDE